MASRNKVEKACSRCRRRKEKCDGRQPVCSPCRSHGSECVYSWTQKKRGLQEGYVHGVERLLALAMTETPGLEETILRIAGDGVTAEDGRFAAMWTDNEHPQGLRKIWRSSRLAKRLESLVRELEQLTPRKMNDLPDIPSARFEQHESAQPEVGDIPATLSLEAIPMPSNILQSLENYFQHTHSWMPILERPHIYQLAYSLSTSWSNLDPPDICCMLSILSCRQPSLDSNEERGDAEVYAMTALRLLPLKATDLRPQHVQASLLLALSRMQAGLIEDAWLLISRACHNRVLLMREQGNRGSWASRIFIASYILDILTSARLQIQPCHSSNIIDQGSPSLQGDQMEEWGPGDHCFKTCNLPCPMRTNSSFSQLFSVTQTLASASDASSVEEQEAARQQLEAFTSRSWYPLGNKAKPPMLPSQITAHLVYLAAVLRLNASSIIPVNQHFTIVNSLLPLQEYVTSTIQSSHIPAIWEPVFTILLDLLQARLTNGDHMARSSIDAIHALVAELDGRPAFQALKSRCTSFETTRPSNVNGEIAQTEQTVPSLDNIRSRQLQTGVSRVEEQEIPDLQLNIEGLEQQALSDALDAEVDWDTTLISLGFMDGENIAGLDSMTTDLGLQ